MIMNTLNGVWLDPARIRKVDKLYGDELDFKDIKFQFKVRNICKIEKKNSIDISDFVYEDKRKYPIYVSKNFCEDKHDLLLIEERDKKSYLLIKDFNTFMYDYILHREEKAFLPSLFTSF